MTKGIYQLKIPGCEKVYIGKSQDIEKRFQQHLRQLLNGDHHNPGMGKVFQGELELTILLEGNCSSTCEQIELNKVPRKLQFNYYAGVDDGWRRRRRRSKRL